MKQTRRILALGTKDCGVLNIIKDLTGDSPSPDASGSVAGVTHHWDIQTKYYSTRVSIWIDELSDPNSWKAEFLKPEAAEVVNALGGWIYCFRKPSTTDQIAEVETTIEAIQEVVHRHVEGEGGGEDIVMLAVITPAREESQDNQRIPTNSTSERLEDVCILNGFELVDGNVIGKNSFGGTDGIERIREALEANSWDINIGGDDDALFDDTPFLFSEQDHEGLGREEAEMTTELFGLGAALRPETQEDDEAADSSIDPNQPQVEEASQVDDLDRILRTLAIVKERSASLPEAERKRVAAEAVRRIMHLEP